MRKEDLSPAEIVLTDYFGVSEIIESHSIDMVSIYRIMVEHAFMKNDKSCYADALRAAWFHIQSGKYRKTPEFESLILKHLRKGKLKKLSKNI
jgi:hypothetical protein